MQVPEAGKWQEALCLLQQTEESLLQPNGITYQAATRILFGRKDKLGPQMDGSHFVHCLFHLLLKGMQAKLVVVKPRFDKHGFFSFHVVPFILKFSRFKLIFLQERTQRLKFC